MKPAQSTQATTTTASASDSTASPEQVDLVHLPVVAIQREQQQVLWIGARDTALVVASDGHHVATVVLKKLGALAAQFGPHYYFE